MVVVRKMKGGIGPLALLAVIVVLVVIAIGAYAWLTVGKYISLGSQQGFRVLAANQIGTVSQVMGNMTGGFATPQFMVSYYGNATVSIQGLKLSLPLSVNVSRYYNESRAGIKLSGIPLVGNFSIVQIKNGSRYYTCSGANSSKVSFKCAPVEAGNSIFSLLNFSSGAVSGSLGNMPVHFGTVNQSSRNGVPCTNIDGYFNYTNSSRLQSLNLSSEVGKHVSSANLTFLSCVSGDRIPLSFYVVAVARSGNATTSAALKLAETSYVKTSSSAIAALPGPLVNATR